MPWNAHKSILPFWLIISRSWASQEQSYCFENNKTDCFKNFLVLPKHEVKIKLPQYMALDQKEFTTTICAKWVFLIKEITPRKTYARGRIREARSNFDSIKRLRFSVFFLSLSLWFSLIHKKNIHILYDIGKIVQHVTLHYAKLYSKITLCTKIVLKCWVL